MALYFDTLSRVKIFSKYFFEIITNFSKLHFFIQWILDCSGRKWWCNWWVRNVVESSSDHFSLLLPYRVVFDAYVELVIDWFQHFLANYVCSGDLLLLLFFCRRGHGQTCNKEATKEMFRNIASALSLDENATVAVCVVTKWN